MSNKYQDDLKRIVGVKSTGSKLAPPPLKDKIGSNRGIGYYLDPGNSTGGGSSSGGGAGDDDNASAGSSAGSTQARSPGSSEGVQQLLNISLFGQQGGNMDLNGDGEDDQGREFSANGGNGGGRGGGGGGAGTAFTTKEGIFTAAEVFTNAGPKPGESLSDPSGFQISGGILREMVTNDCDSGKEMRIRFDGQYPPPDATYFQENNQSESNIQSIAWEDPDTKPNRPYTNIGYVWSGFNFDTSQTDYAVSPNGLINHIIAAYGVNFLNVVVNSESSITVNSIFTLANVTRADCSTTVDPLAEALCGIYTSGSYLDLLKEPHWPNTGFYDQSTRSDKLTRDASQSFIMSIDGGAFKPHPLDPNVPADFSQGVSKVDFCWGSGQFGTAAPTKDGGFTIYETVTKGGDIVDNGIVRIYNSSGKATGFTDKVGLGGILP